ncbi:MAG: MFS transporter [Sphingomonadales bacterium]
MALAPATVPIPEVFEPEAEAGPAASAQPWPRPAVAWYALSLFVLATMMNFMDRGVFTLMIEMIKKDFQLTDVQLGLLLGPAGVLFYLLVGIPLARLVDIYPRNIILAAGLVITNGITALGGIVQNYGQLFGSRMMVGVGGSAHAPGVYSMMADYFPPKRLPRAIAVLQAGFILGTGLASILGGIMLGYVADWQPTRIGPLLIHNWQWVLMSVGIPGLIIAIFIFALREPPRRGKISTGGAMPIREVFREIWRRRSVYFPLFAGLALTSIEAQGIQEWRAPFMTRTYGWTPAQIGAWGGAVVFIAMPIGVVFGTWLTERIGRRHKDAPIRVTAIVFAMCAPFMIAAPWMPTGELAIICTAMSGVFGIAAAVPQNTAIQTVTPNEMRGQVTAVYLFMFTVFGALGSFVIALVTKYIVGDEQKLWLSITMTAAVVMPLAVLAITRAIKPYREEIERLEAIGRVA